MKVDTFSLKLVNGKFTLVEKTATKIDFIAIVLLMTTFTFLICLGYSIYILSN